MTEEQKHSFREWLRRQYGRPGSRYRSARQLSLAISEGANANLIFDIEKRASAKIETFAKLAEALEVPLIEVFIEAGWLREEARSCLSEEDQEILAVYHRSPDRPLMRRILEAAAQYEDGSVQGSQATS